MVNPSDIYNKYHSMSTKQIAKSIIKLNNGKTVRQMYRESGKFNNINNNVVWGCINEEQLRTTGITFPLVINTGTSPNINFSSVSVFTPLLTISCVNNLEGIFNREFYNAYQEAIKNNDTYIILKFDINKYINIIGYEYDNIFKAIDFTLFIKQ